MKKLFALLLALLFCVAPICGCNLSNSLPASLGDSIELPESGVVAAHVFEEMKRENKIVRFYAVSNGIHYEWTVFGSDIESPKDLNLGIQITSVSPNDIVFSFISKENFGFSPVLSITLNETWNAQSATVYKIADDVQTPIGGADTVIKDKCILNFSPPFQVGSLEIRAKSENDAPSQTTSPTAPNSKGTGTKDKYNTDPVPEGKPKPVEPDDINVNKKIKHTCTFSIECSSIINNLSDLDPNKLDVLPPNGVLFAPQTVEFYEGESLYDLLVRVCRENGIQMEAVWTPIYNSAYVEGINNLYEFDCGSGSGWMYCVNGWYPNYGCSRYKLCENDNIAWRYTCNLGKDIGGASAVGE